MKRYTGQKALYEAISRSRAKAKHGNILERFLPESIRQENAVPPEGEQPPAEPVPTADTTPPVAKEPPKPVVEKEPPKPVVEKEKEKLREPVIVREPAKLRRLTPAEKIEAPPENPVVSAAKLRPVEKIERPAPPRGPVQTWWRLKPVQLNAGRVEISVPYHIGVVAILVVLLVVLVAYRIGQKHPGNKTKAAAAAKAPAQAEKQNAAAPETTAAKSSPSTSAAATTPPCEPAQPQGDNLIVVTQHKNREDLVPVVAYFAQNGITLEIYALSDVRRDFVKSGLNTSVLPSGDGYLLVTEGLYRNPDSPGTDGYKMKQTIRELGLKYKAPKGRETFGKTPFHDAYGMKCTRAKQ
jgi:hypothetical protein